MPLADCASDRVEGVEVADHLRIWPAVVRGNRCMAGSEAQQEAIRELGVKVGD